MFFDFHSWDVPGLSWDVPCGILRTPSRTNQELPKTVLGCPMWDPPDTKSHQSSGTSQDCPGMSHVGSSGHSRTNLQERPKTVLGCPMWDPPDTKSHQYRGTSQDCPGMSHVGFSGHQVAPIFRDVPRLSWDVPCGILRTPSHTNIEGCPRTVLGYPMWDPPDTKSHQY